MCQLFIDPIKVYETHPWRIFLFAHHLSNQREDNVCLNETSHDPIISNVPLLRIIIINLV